MSSFYSDPDIPRYIYIVGMTGIVCLVISLITFIIFYSVYHEKIDKSVTPFNNDSVGLQVTSISSIVFFSLGTFLSLFILYGHILKQRKDPQVIFGPRSYIEFPSNGEFFNVEEETSNIYKGRLNDIANVDTKLNTDFL